MAEATCLVAVEGFLAEARKIAGEIWAEEFGLGSLAQ
jgi:hypothetical protein